MIAIFAALLALAALLYTGVAIIALGRFRIRAMVAADNCPAITILRPLYGAEPGLADNFETLLTQDYAGPVQIICGVRDSDDPAIAIIGSLQARYRAAAIQMIVNPERLGANNKISNLHNMAAHAEGDIIIISDSDVALPPYALTRLSAALADPETGMASCFHGGLARAGFWSHLAAMDISYRFSPSVAVSAMIGLGHPALGPTMALRRETWESIGGFAPFANIIAEDYAMGRAVRALGLKSVIPGFCIAHGCSEQGITAMIGHELRWTRTIYGVDPVGFTGSLLTHPLPLSLLACALQPAYWPLIGIAVIARCTLAWRMDAIAGWSSGAKLLLPLRDLFSFAVFVMTFFVKRVDWRGQMLKIEPKGHISTIPENPA